MVLKDYVKSEKHHWAEATFVPDVRDVAAARRVAERFIELRGPELLGGLVVRRFERYEGPDVRTWWVDGRAVLITAHPDQLDAAVATQREQKTRSWVRGSPGDLHRARRHVDEADVFRRRLRDRGGCRLCRGRYLRLDPHSASQQAAVTRARKFDQLIGVEIRARVAS
jgi:hypothetical protein